MKKSLLLATLLASCSTMFAQFTHVDTTLVNLDAAVSLNVGQNLGTIAGKGTLSVPFVDTWKQVGTATDGYGIFTASGSALNTATSAIQGQSNGKDADGGNPATTLLPYASGAAICYTAEADGYLTIFHKGSSNKQYVVFEEGTAVGYEYAQLVKIGEAPEAIGYVVNGEGELNEVKEPIMKVEEICPTAPSGEAVASKNGMSAMRFPVYKDCKYLFGATGSKMSLIGVYFSQAKEEIAVAKLEGTDPIVLLSSNSTSISNVAASANNSVVYNLLGQRVAADTKGLVIINGKKVIRK